MIHLRKAQAITFFSLVFSALALGTTLAHVLELPQKVAMPAELYAAINTSLYKWFALAGGPICLLAVFFTVWMVRIAYQSGLTTLSFLYAAVLQAAWLTSWLSLVRPVNSIIEQATTGQAAVVHLWAKHFWRWEIGHLVGFIFHLGAFCFLVKGLLKFSSLKKLVA